MPDCIYDPAVLLASPEQLRHCVCGHPMTPSQDGRHTLVYRCDPALCGGHTAHITDIEAALLSEYRDSHAYESRGRSDHELRESMYRCLKLGWVKHGQLVGGAATFRYIA